MRIVALLPCLLAILLGLASCTTTRPQEIPEIRPGILKGYLEPAELPDSFALLPAPPGAGSEAQASDVAASTAAQARQGSSRWELATLDNDLHFPGAAGTFSCALGVAIDEVSTPRLYMLLRRSLTDAGLATYGAKDHYQRARPFTVNGGPICASDEERAMLANDGSYPSGHTAIGWAWALILTELMPERADLILQRGYQYGVSRVICNVHWQSDTLAGRTVGAAAVARLHASEEFLDDLAAARRELATTASAPPSRDCAAEAAALARSP
jgi:acid phosphatase (class A)